MPFINTKTTVSLSKSKKDSLTAEICRITRSVSARERTGL